MTPNEPRVPAPVEQAPAQEAPKAEPGAVIEDPVIREQVMRRIAEAAAEGAAETAPEPEEYSLEDIIKEVHGWENPIAEPGDQPKSEEAPKAPEDQPTEPEPVSQPEKLTKSAEAEKKLESVNARIEEIKKEFEDAYREKEEAAEAVQQYEKAVSEIGEEISGLETELGKYKAEVRETGQTLTERLKQGLNLIKDILKGDNKAIRQTLQEAMTANEQNEAAKAGEAETSGKLSDAYARRDSGEKELATAKQAELSADAKIRALENELKMRQFEAEALEDEIGIQKNLEERATERSRIEAELKASGLSVTEARRKLFQDREKTMAEYDKKAARFTQLASDIPLLAELGVSVEGYSKENLDARLAALEAERDEKIGRIDNNLFALDDYFPTFKDRVGDVLKNVSVKNALASMRRKNVIKNISLPEDEEEGEHTQPSAEEALSYIDPDKRAAVA